MERQPGSYIEDAIGGLTPNQNDQAMAERHPLAGQSTTAGEGPAAPVVADKPAAVESAPAEPQEEENHDHA